MTKGLQDILADLSLFPDRHDRIQALIDIADSFRQVPPGVIPTPYPEENRVPGCESEAFGFTILNDQGKLHIEFAILNPQGISAMAMGKIIQESLNGEPPSAVKSIDEDLVYTIFGRELSMGKSGGLTNMIRLIKSQASKLS